MGKSFLNTKTNPDRAYLRAVSAEADAGTSSGNRVIRGGAPNKKKSAKKKKKGKFWYPGLGIDMPFCLMVAALLIVGTVMMFSASYPTAYAETGDSFYHLKRQLIYIGVGTAAMVLLSFLNYRIYYKWAKIILAVSFLLLIVVLILPGSGGVKRWIGFGGFTVQASEVTKLCLIIFFAYWCTKYADKMQYVKYSFLPGMAIFGATAVLLLLEPHYSGIVIVFLLTLIMLFLGGMPKKYFIVIGAAVGGVFIIALSTGLLGYAMERMDGWGQALSCEMGSDMWQTTWQTRNSLYAIGSGGIWGLGLGQSRQKYLYLPEPQNDFVFAIICEELGLIGALVILALFGILIWRGIKISRNAKDSFGRLLGCGIVAQVGLQVVLNILVITDWLPNTGISLPFFSAGGSSLIMLMAEMGIVLSVSRTSNLEKV